LSIAHHETRQRPPTDTHLKLSRGAAELLICPCCKGKLALDGTAFCCTGERCAGRFPVVAGVPILLNQETSLFSIESVAREWRPTAARQRTWKAAVRRLLPSISRNIKARENFARLGDLLATRPAPVRVLVLGGGVVGAGMDDLLADKRIEFVETDVTFGPRTGLICDAQEIPFEAQSFDGVIIQAVLCYLLDPSRCVAEIHRVLKPDGLVYAETPFMQQVTGGKIDFIRFTHLGHRRLFGRFTELSSGPVCGPGMALAWSYKYFLLSFPASRMLRSALAAFADVTSFWLTYFDYYLVERPCAIDSASGFFFLGRKAADRLPDRDLLDLYRGCVR
jgi:SAM-dependent methyltransferase/uncharacterized protein YbaR (Trm112 family)